MGVIIGMDPHKRPATIEVIDELRRDVRCWSPSVVRRCRVPAPRATAAARSPARRAKRLFPAVASNVIGCRLKTHSQEISAWGKDRAGTGGKAGAVYDWWNPSAFHRTSTAAAYHHAALEDMIAHAGAEPEGGKDVLPVTQTDREDAVETLQHAAGDGRLPLNELSERVGTALTAKTRHQLGAATAGLKAAPAPGSTRTVSSIVTFLGRRRQAGRWRLPSALRARVLFGDLYLDLRDVTVHDDVVDISATTLFGNLTVDVPEGVEVDPHAPLRDGRSHRDSPPARRRAQQRRPGRSSRQRPHWMHLAVEHAPRRHRLPEESRPSSKARAGRTCAPLARPTSTWPCSYALHGAPTDTRPAGSTSGWTPPAPGTDGR